MADTWADVPLGEEAEVNRTEDAGGLGDSYSELGHALAKDWGARLDVSTGLTLLFPFGMKLPISLDSQSAVPPGAIKISQKEERWVMS